SAGGHSATLPARASTGASRSSGSTSQPSRQPVIAQNFEKEVTTIAPWSRKRAAVGALSRQPEPVPPGEADSPPAAGAGVGALNRAALWPMPPPPVPVPPGEPHPPPAAGPGVGEPEPQPPRRAVVGGP